VGDRFGSGFYLNLETEQYLITARHVLCDENGTLLSSDCKLISSSKDVDVQEEITVTLDLKKLKSSGNFMSHENKDVCAVKIGKIERQNNTSKSFIIHIIDGVKIENGSGVGLLGVSPDSIKKLDSILIANEVIVFGYPRSIGIKKNSQFDYNRPLLRKGIVANTYPKQGTIILDNCVHPGNSGGPVLEIEKIHANKTNFKIIGVVSQYIPICETWKNQLFDYENKKLLNSGYSVAVAMDYVFELIGIDL